MIKRSIATIMVMVAIVCLATANVASCNAQSSNHTNASSSAIGPSPSPSPYLGIQKMWRGYDSAIDKNVFVFWVVPGSGMTPEATQENIFRHIEPDLNGSIAQVVVVKVTVTKGIFYKTSGYIYVKAADGMWGRTDDQELIDKIMRTDFE